MAKRNKEKENHKTKGVDTNQTRKIKSLKMFHQQSQMTQIIKAFNKKKSKLQTQDKVDPKEGKTKLSKIWIKKMSLQSL